MENKIKKMLLDNSSALFNQEINENGIQFQKTRKEVTGDFTLVVFPFVKILKKSPEEIGNKIGHFLQENIPEIESFETIKGFLNLSLTKEYWKNKLIEIAATENFGFAQNKSGKTFMVEYSSPNTNKPLHLGHLRNIFLGYGVAEILKANGHEVIKTQIVNDRGIHVCKSMIAWQQFATKNEKGERETPQSAGMKGDHFVGKYYVEYDKQVTLQGFELATKWKTGNYADPNISIEAKEKLPELFLAFENTEEPKKRTAIQRKIAAYATPFTVLAIATKKMLVDWENKVPEVYDLWAKMNGWVYEGFDKTYSRMEVDFDKIYYESDTYLLGKKVVLEGLEKGVFYAKEDGSVWIDLTEDGLDEKLVLRADGTAVYMTQDIGTAIERFKDYSNLNGIVYTVGNEQDYHFQVLFLILKKLGYSWAENCYHLSYGMVDLPDGKMKSREGRVVDADDLMEEVVDLAFQATQERGQIDELSEDEKEALYEIIGLGGIKYFILKVDPKKRITFNPDESIELNGNTAAFVQYTYARINSLLTKVDFPKENDTIEIQTAEKELIKQLYEYPAIVREAGENYSPALIINYVFELVKNFNSFYQSHSVLKEENLALKNARIIICQNVGKVIKSAMKLIGIQVPQRM